MKVFGLLGSEKKLIVSRCQPYILVPGCKCATRKKKTFESLSLDFSEMDVPFMFLGERSQRQRVIIVIHNHNRYYENTCILYIYMQKYANIHTYIYI